MTVETRALRMLFFLDYEERGIGKFAHSPGLLPFIGHVRAKGFDIEFVSTSAELFSALQNPLVDVVGISSMQRMLARSIVVAQEVRLQRPDIVLMIGGCALEPFAVDLASSLFDIVVLGEAEHVLPAVLEALARAHDLGPRRERREGVPTVCGQVRQVADAQPGGALDKACVEQILSATIDRDVVGLGLIAVSISDVYVRDSTRGIVWFLAEPQPETMAASALAIPEKVPARYLKPAPVEKELDSLCLLPWDIYAREGWRRFEFCAQRGCRWGRCHFCTSGDQPIRRQSPAKVVSVVAEAIAHGVDTVSFADDHFVQDIDWTRELLTGLRALNGKVSYQAQTMPNRAVWPLLDEMHQAGFVELAFGLETLDPTRAEFLGKTLNGRTYVEQAMQTIRRTAAAGIYPVLYMIMVDPASTLVQIVKELYETLNYLIDVYDDTGILPKLSYSLMLLPIASTRLADDFAYRTEPIRLGDRCIELPTHFEFSPPILEYLSRMGSGTANLPYRRENLAAFACYLESVAAVATEYQDPHRPQICACAERGLEVLHDLIHRLDTDIDRTICGLYSLAAPGAADSVQPVDPLDYRRFGGYITGIQRFGESLRAALAERQSEKEAKCRAPTSN